MAQNLPAQRAIVGDSTHQPRDWTRLFVASCAVVVATFLLLPWSLEGKALAVLHGLCAQQPDHTFYFGARRLPFDARMTGIYGGFAGAAAWLLARGRCRHGDLPPLRSVAVLTLFVVVLAVDGANSTLRDLGLTYGYEPRNELRLVTGLLTGTSLAVFLWLMTVQVGFARGARVRKPVVAGARDVGGLLLVPAIIGMLVVTRWEPMRTPVTLLLLASAVTVLLGLSLAFVLLLGRRENRALATRDLAGPAFVSLVIALIILGATSGVRFWLEAALNIPPAVRGGS